MPDINPNTSLHLPIDVWIINAAQIINGTVTTLQGIMDNGYNVVGMLDDETQLFRETKTPVEVPRLAALGPQIKDLKILRGPAEVQLPMSCWNYTVYAIMQGLDPDVVIQDNIPVSLNAPDDSVALMLNQQETLDTVRFALLAHVQPPDPAAGDRYILLPKLFAEMENVDMMLQSSYYQQTMGLKSATLLPDEVEPWQEVLSVIQASIPMYIFNLSSV